MQRPIREFGTRIAGISAVCACSSPAIATWRRSTTRIDLLECMRAFYGELRRHARSRSHAAFSGDSHDMRLSRWPWAVLIGLRRAVTGW